MMTQQEMVEYLEANRIRKEPKPKPKEPSAVERAVERFAEDHKPTVAVVQDAAAHNRALLRRLRDERVAADRPSYQQALINNAWESTRDQQDALTALERGLCHRSPGELGRDDWVWRR